MFLLYRQLILLYCLLQIAPRGSESICPYRLRPSDPSDLEELVVDCVHYVASWNTPYLFEYYGIDFHCTNDSSDPAEAKHRQTGVRARSYEVFLPSSVTPTPSQVCSYYGCIVQPLESGIHFFSTVTCTGSAVLVAPTTTAKVLASPTSVETPPTSALAPPTSTLAPPTSALAPPTSTLAPPTSTLAPPTSALAPPTSTLAPPTSVLAPPTPSTTPTAVSSSVPDDLMTSTALFPVHSSTVQSPAHTSSISIELPQSEPLVLASTTDPTVAMNTNDSASLAVLTPLLLVGFIFALTVLVMLLLASRHHYSTKRRTKEFIKRQKAGLGLPIPPSESFDLIDDSYLEYIYSPLPTKLSYSPSEPSVCTLLEHLTPKPPDYDSENFSTCSFQLTTNTLQTDKVLQLDREGEMNSGNFSWDDDGEYIMSMAGNSSHFESSASGFNRSRERNLGEGLEFCADVGCECGQLGRETDDSGSYFMTTGSGTTQNADGDSDVTTGHEEIHLGGPDGVATNCDVSENSKTDSAFCSMNDK